MTLKTRSQLEALFPGTERTELTDQADLLDFLDATPLRTADDDPETVAEIIEAAGTATTTAIEALNLGTASTHAEDDFVLSSVVTTVGGQLISAADAAAGRTALGLGSAATHPDTDFQAAGDYATNSALTSGLAGKADAAATTSALDAKAPLSSPAFTDIPTAPTAAPGTNTTQLATCAFAKNEAALAAAALVAGAPSTLDTLDEIAAALNDDANLAATLTTLIGTKQAGDATLTGLAAPTTAANKLLYATGVDTFATTDYTAAARTFDAATDAAGQRLALSLPTSSQTSPDILAALRSYVQVSLVCNDLSAFDIRYVAKYSWGSDHYFTIPVTTGGDLNFQGVGGKTKASGGFWFEYQDSSANTGGAESGAGLNANRTLMALSNRAATPGAAIGSQGGYVFLQPTNSRFDAYIDTGSGFINVIFNSSTLLLTMVPGLWYFLYWEFDGDGADNQAKLKISINGVQLVLNNPTATTLGVKFRDMSAGVFTFGRGVFATDTSQNFDGRMCEAFTANVLLSEASSATFNDVATAIFNDYLPMTQEQLVSQYPDINHLWRFNENSTRMTAFDSIGSLHLTRKNNVGYAMQIEKYTCPYTGLEFTPISPAIGDLQHRIKYEADYEPSGRYLTSGVPGVRQRMSGDRATPGVGGRGFHCFAKDWCKKTTGILAYKVAWGVVPTSEAFPFYTGSYVEGHLQDMWVLSGVWGTSNTGGGKISITPFRCDSFYLGGSAPQAIVTTTVSGQTSGLHASNYQVVIGTPYTLYAASENTSSSATGVTPGPYVAIVNSTLSQTLYVSDGGGATPAPNGFLTLIEGRDVLGFFGDPAADATMQWFAALAPMVSAADKATILASLAALP